MRIWFGSYHSFELIKHSCIEFLKYKFEWF